MADTHEGGCVCGNVRYRATGEPILATVCHCKFCQKRTGSAFSQPVVFKAEQVEFSGGQRTTYEHHSDESHRWLRMELCPHCGTTVAWRAERRPGTIAIAGGTFDDPDWVKIQRHIWTRSAQRWMPIPADLECFEKGSPT
jgi:hypothetical protein